MTKINKERGRYNPVNERIKYKYRQRLRRIDQKDKKTIISILKHIRDFEIFTGFKGFEKFDEQIADKYIENMFKRNISLPYITGSIRALKAFLKWLERQHGYRSKINYNHIDYLSVSRNQRKEAKATTYQKSYSFEQIISTIRHMPNSTDKEKRDQALISLQATCTLRVSELRTVKIQNIIEENQQYFVYVTPKNMSVKTAKTREAVFVPLPHDIIANVITWRDYLLSQGFKDNDPLFPKIDNNFTQTNLLEQTLKKEEIKSNTTIRKIFQKAFEAVGLEYIRPHSFRNTLARYAETQSPEFLNAVRQNLGHESIDTTLSSYGQLSRLDQRNVINSVSIEA